MKAILCGLAAAILMTGHARADEEKVPLDKLPKAVADGFKKRFPGARPTGASKETTEDKKTVYEVTFKDKGKNVDVTVTEAGVITTIEKQIDAKELPKAVTESLEKKYPKATRKIIEAVYSVKDNKETLNFYEVLLVTAEKKQIEVQILADGKIKAEEEKKSEYAP